MAKPRKSPEEKLGALIREIGFDKAEAAFRLLKSYETKPEPKQRKKPPPPEPPPEDIDPGRPFRDKAKAS